MSTKAMIITMFLCLIVRKTVEFRWTTQVLSATCCEGRDKTLVWSYSLDKNDRIRQLQWYYNNSTLICYKSESYGFNVAQLYDGRVEQIGTAGILLKNVSSGDAGEYTLYSKLSGETFRNVQAILLTVLGPPKVTCKPTITRISQNIITCSMNTCDKPQISTEWRIEGDNDPVGNDNHLIMKSSWTGKLVFCCPYKPMIECHARNELEFCTPFSIPSITKDDSHTENPTRAHTPNVPKTEDTRDNGIVQTLSIIAVVLFLVIMALLVAFLVVRQSRKRRTLVNTKQDSGNKANVCTKELATQHKARHPTDQHCSGSGQNQDIQIANNIDISGMFDWFTALKTESMALKEENRQLANLLYRYKCTPQLKDKDSYDDSMVWTSEIL